MADLQLPWMFPALFRAETIRDGEEIGETEHRRKLRSRIENDSDPGCLRKRKNGGFALAFVTYDSGHRGPFSLLLVESQCNGQTPAHFSDRANPLASKKENIA